MTEFDCFMDEVMVIGQGMGGNPDWNQNDDTAPDYVKNRTHYEETITVNEPLNLTWDGNTEGLVSVLDILYKVSDLVLTDEQIKLGTMCANNGISVPVLDIWDDCVAEGMVTTDIVFFGEMIVFVRKDGAMLYDTIIPEQGIYFVSTNDVYVSAFTTTEPVELTKTVVHKLDSKYLPYISYNTLINKPDIPKVDQTYSPNSENAQSGKAVAEALSQISFDKLNIRNSTGKYSLQQIQDTKYTGISLYNPEHPDDSKNLNAVNLDETLIQEQPIGATGEFASSFGGASSAQGKRSLAEGTNTIAKGKYSHAEGDNSVALGNESHAEGYATTAYGTGSHAEGSGTQAIGKISHAEGANTIAEGDASHAGGSGAIARGTHSFAHGNGVIASMNNQVAFGKFNAPTEALYVIGDGYDDKYRSNAFEVFGGYNQEKYATVGGQRLATEQQLTMVGEYFTQYVDTQTGKKTVAGEIIEITNLDSRQSAVIDSTVTDNYFYKENFITENYEYDIQGYTWHNKPTGIYLKGQGKYSEVTIGRNKFDDGFVNRKTGYIIFTTPNDTSGCDVLSILWSENCTIPIKPLKNNHQYMLIIKYGDTYDDGTALRQYVSIPYLVDYEDAYHWIKGTSVDNIPFPNSIMIPHIGRIDKGDTLTATYTTSEQYKAFFGIDENGNHYINIGNTKVTEDQIKKLLTLIS